MKNIILLVVALLSLNGCAGIWQKQSEPATKTNLYGMLRTNSFPHDIIASSPMMYECFGMRQDEATANIANIWESTWSSEYSSIPEHFSAEYAEVKMMDVMQKTLLKYLWQNMDKAEGANLSGEKQKKVCEEFIDRFPEFIKTIAKK